MIRTPVNSNPMYIPIIRSGYDGFKFDSTYPIRLNGIISQDEFRESINRINNACAIRRGFKLFKIILVLITIIGIISFIIASAIEYEFDVAYSSILGIGGICLSICGCTCYLCTCHSFRLQRARQIQEAINEESAKYSSRSPISCRWTFKKVIRSSVEGQTNQSTRLSDYYLVIDIGRPTSSRRELYYSNQFANASTLLLGLPEEPPPPYPGPSTRSCFQCGVLSQDLSAKFCSSCGQSLNRN